MTDVPVEIVASILLQVQAAGGDKIFAIESVVGENLSDESCAAGWNALNSASVPTGKIWVITAASMRFVSNTVGYFRFCVVRSSVEFWLLLPSSPVTNTLYPWNGSIILGAGDYLQVAVTGATALDDLYFHYLGYQMDAP